MSYFGSEEHEPITWMRGYPVYATHLVVAVFTVSMLFATVFSQTPSIPEAMIFTSDQVLHGQVWRVFSYGLWNPPSLWFAIKMLMLFWFGREVERSLGRWKFLALYGCIYVLPPLLFTAVGPWLPMALAGESGSFALFIAFATLHPNAPMFFTLLAKWVALILVGIYTLVAFADRSWEQLLLLWSTTGFAYAFIRHEQGHFSLPRLPRLRRRPKLRVLPDLPSPPATPTPRATRASMAEVDALLDKIAQSGIGSLTAKERAKLDAAREELKRRSGA
ncbi:rhomboid family intramembrane serine protease [Opitutus sp. ER46]|uniref:rhomboid family intramembrane serine protease n=1 Tax=Opitutus sp. ER46 TaxID=2161864 RepID=UPI000D2FBD83|nr:rhomboid family intramembrane serine protease [Opitutus sp. ER46]PTX95569.1 hypothetical protein DB354_09110 [Opitutus sp. ER46]